MTRRILLWGMIVGWVLPVAATSASAAGGGEKRGEIGVQVGVRWADRDIVPESSNGFGFAYGLEGAWEINHRRAPPDECRVSRRVGSGLRQQTLKNLVL